MEQKLIRNIRLVGVIEAANMFMISMAIIVPYWNTLGLNQANIYQLQAIFLLTVVTFEVPSGYFADVYGRKKSLLFGQILASLAWVAYALAFDFFTLALCEVMLGIGMSLKSGADKALRYDSLLQLKRESDNLRYDSRASAIGSFGEGVAGLLASALVLISLKTPIYGQAIYAALLIPIPFFLTEVGVSSKGSKLSAANHPWRNLARIVRYSLHGNISVKWLVLYSASVGTMTYTAVWLMQPFYEEVGVAIGWFGVLWFAKHAFLSAFGYKAEWIKNMLGLSRMVIALPLVGIVTYVALGVGYNLWVMPAFIGFELIRGVQTPVVRDEINKLIPSDIRATVISVQGLVVRLQFAIFGLIMGGVSQNLGIRNAFIVSAVIYGIICVPVALRLNSFSAREQSTLLKGA